MPKTLAPPRERDLAQSAQDVTSIFDDYGFPPTGKLEHYCARRLLQPDDTKLTIDVFATQDPPSKLVEFYRQRLGERGLKSEAEHTTWELPAGSPAPQRVLSITTPRSNGRHQACEAPPKGKPRSILILTKLN